MTLPDTAQVAVVGAGPTGLAAACRLQGAGVDVVVLDQAAHGADTSRAAVVHARTLEVLEDVGMTSRLVAEGCVVPVFTLRDRSRVIARLDFAGLPTAYPYTLMLPQDRIEALLTARLGELGGRVHRPWQLTGVTSSPAGAVLEVSDAAGHRRQVAADHVVGADGMHSTVRRCAGIGFTGAEYEASFVLADVHLRWPLPDTEVQLFLSPAGLVVVAPLPGGRHRVVATVEDAPPTPGQDLVQALLDERGPGGARVESVVWASRFRVHHRLADAYRAGPLLLAGDAAHVHSPAGGQGMNTGIQDGLDLAGTLVDVIEGRVPDGAAALEDYGRRRRPVAEQVIALTDRATRMATLRSRPARAARNVTLSLATRLPAVRRRLAARIAELPAGR
jgi:2-polyprenyl-6-methoxyphenol hydroxylase-like FAD-dependent oxidoreductase